jgi:hypothetical protein
MDPGDIACPVIARQVHQGKSRWSTTRFVGSAPICKAAKEARPQRQPWPLDECDGLVDAHTAAVARRCGKIFCSLFDSILRFLYKRWRAETP